MAGGLKSENPESGGSISDTSAGPVREDVFLTYWQQVLGDGGGEVFFQGSGGGVFSFRALFHGWLLLRGPRPRRGLLQHCVEPNLQEPG